MSLVGGESVEAALAQEEPEAPAAVVEGSDVPGGVVQAVAPSINGVQERGDLSVGSARETSAVLKMKGLPYNTSQEQILDFFSGFAVKNISFVGEPDGRPSGLAFAEFESKEEALKALNKNGEYIGERYVRLLHVPKSEMEEQVRLGTLAIPGTAAKLRSRIMRGGHQPGVLPQRNPMMGGGPQGAYGAPPLMPGPGMPPGLGGPRGPPPMAGPYGDGQPNAWAGSYANPASLSAQFAGMSLRGQQGGGRGGMGGGRVPQGGAAPMMLHPGAAAPPHPHAHPGMGGLHQAGMGLATSQAQVMSNAHAAVHNPTSSTVKVRGLPYRSSPAEILAFFSGFQYLPDSLQIGLDSLGRPSGEAWLSFINANEALKSVRDLNRHFLGNRYLELSIC
mmetsp:Transcript_28108/g.75907  ORF Transcript_28108/g.75907 Transcript_28108/m.75907 type:complete len:391 (+) Transcript_28108:35-1207(+)